MDYQKAVTNIRAELKEYLKEAGLKSLVLGMSGGIDSTLCAVLARPVCDDLGITLIGRSIPIDTNKPDEIDRARMTGECFCHDFKEVDLTSFYKVAKFHLCDMDLKSILKFNDVETKIRLGNIKARLRMIHLYDIAQVTSGMVLSTDNYTENLLGFWTLHGDVGDFCMLQYLWKTEVYGLSSYLANEMEGDRAKEAIRVCIEAKATDGLGISESDVEQFGAKSYDEVDEILKNYIINGYEYYKDHPVIVRYKRTKFKRDNPFNIPRERIL